MKPKVLVTGAAGYIGSVAAEILLNENYSIVALDDLSTGHEESLFENVKFYESTVGNNKALEKIFTENKIDVVLHIAGAAIVSESTIDPHKYFDINFCQAQNLLDKMIRFNVKKIVFSSTCAIYGIPKDSDIPIKEETIKSPINPYGESKLLFENALNWYKENHGIDFISLRYFNVAGATKKRGEKHNPETHLIPSVIKAAYDKNYKLKLFGSDYPTNDGTAIRDYIHVLDLNYAHLKAIEILLQNKRHNNFYNLGYGHGYSVLEIVNAAKEILKKEIIYKIEKRREGDAPILVANATKIRNDLNWIPRYDNIYEIIKSASDFYKNFINY